MNQAAPKSYSSAVFPLLLNAGPTSVALRVQRVYTSVRATRTGDTIYGEFMWCFSLKRFSSSSGRGLELRRGSSRSLLLLLAPPSSLLRVPS